MRQVPEKFGEPRAIFGRQLSKSGEPLNEFGELFELFGERRNLFCGTSRLSGQHLKKIGAR